MRVLVVEDEKDLGRAVKKALEEDGYSCDLTTDGDMGLFNSQSWDYDAVVLDIMLPKRDGWSVLKTLRATKKTPVLILTARDTVVDRVRGLDGGADDYLTKPFALQELLARVRALIRRSADHPSPLIALGDIEIDTAARIVKKGGKPVDLAPKEYALVELLALNRGKLVTRTTIYEHIYDEEESTLSNVVDVYIANIRRKLGRDLIETRRGHGYIVHG